MWGISKILSSLWRNRIRVWFGICIFSSLRLRNLQLQYIIAQVNLTSTVVTACDLYNCADAFVSGSAWEKKAVSDILSALYIFSNDSDNKCFHLPLRLFAVFSGFCSWLHQWPDIPEDTHTHSKTAQLPQPTTYISRTTVIQVVVAAVITSDGKKLYIKM